MDISNNPKSKIKITVVHSSKARDSYFRAIRLFFFRIDKSVFSKPYFREQFGILI